MKKITPQTLKKIANGDSITDDELLSGMEFFHAMASGSRALGPSFDLFTIKLYSELERLEGFYRARFKGFYPKPLLDMVSRELEKKDG